MSPPDHTAIARRLVAQWKQEATDGEYQRHTSCEIGQPCTHIDDRLVMYIARALVELTDWHRRNGVEI